MEDCNAPIAHRGWCSKHYQRWIRHGNPAAVEVYRRHPFSRAMWQRWLERLNADPDTRHARGLAAFRQLLAQKEPQS